MTALTDINLRAYTHCMFYIDDLDSAQGLDWWQGCCGNHSQRDEKSYGK